MDSKMKKHEIVINAIVFILLMLCLVYVGYFSELLKGKIHEAHRFIICAVFIYGSYKLSCDVVAFVYKRISQRGAKTR